MKEKQDYIQDIAEIRSMMERSSKFLSLSGWAGIMAGFYALAGSYIAASIFDFHPDQIIYMSPSISKVIVLGIVILVLALGTAIFLSYKRAKDKGESIWNAASRRLLTSMAVPLSTGGILILILISKDLTGLSAPLTLLFYGLALYNTSRFTYDELKYLGLIQICLGLISTWLIQYSLLFWALGFGVFHLIYGGYMYFRYER